MNEHVDEYESENAKAAIEDAQSIMEWRGYQALLILVVGQDGVLRTTVVGEDTVKTSALKWWAENVIDPSLTTIPFGTMFGWGNDGKPIKLDAIQLKDVEDIPFADYEKAYKESNRNEDKQSDKGNT